MMLAAAPSAQAQTEMRQSFDLGYELRNFAKTNERARAPFSTYP